jgi:DNA mismatch repair protein MutS2
MKTVALLQYMFQKGFPLPVDEDTRMGVYTQLFGDIGDQQSIEDDLSTYSSKLKNLKFFIEHADQNTLIIIDEFGSGTDPKLGGAIAEAVLKELNSKKLSAVITTHYSNLKIYAYKNRGIVNGAMVFNKEKLKPSYQLKIGRPGSSFAFEIAQQAGLQNSVLKYAKHKAGKSTRAVEELLIDLQSEKKEVEDRIETIRQKEQELDRLSKSIQHLQAEMEYKRKKRKYEEKQKEFVSKDSENKAFEKLIRELRESKNIERAKQAAKKIREEKRQLTAEISDKRQELRAAHTNDEVELKVGDAVKMRTGDQSGTILSIQKGKADIVMGNLQMRIAISELLPAKEPLPIQRTKNVNTKILTQLKEEESQKLDIRGMLKHEALSMVEQFLDNALLTNKNQVRIIHGKGGGVLKKMVRKKIKEYDMVQEVYHPADENGGDGVTIIRF